MTLNATHIAIALRRLWYNTRTPQHWLAVRRSWHLTPRFIRRQIMLAITENAPTPLSAVQLTNQIVSQPH